MTRGNAVAVQGTARFNFMKVTGIPNATALSHLLVTPFGSTDELYLATEYNLIVKPSYDYAGEMPRVYLEAIGQPVDDVVLPLSDALRHTALELGLIIA